jgi:hypothetical protein
MSLNIKVIFSAEGAPEIVSAIQKLRQEEQKLSTTTGATKRQFDKLGEALNKNTRATERLAESKEDASKKMGLFSRQLRGVRGSLAKFRSITLIAAFTVNMFDRTLGALTRAAKQQEEAIARLEQTLRSTRFAAKVTSKELQGFASQLQRLTGIGDETILAMQGILLTFTQIRGQVFKDATQAILDVSVAMGQDLQQTAIQVGKALNDPILGVSALSRVGIQFTNVQKEQIKQFARGGEMAKAQAIILEELQVQFGGTAANLDKTTFQVRRLQAAFGDFLETGGGKLRPIVEFLSEQLADLFTALASTPEGNFNKALNMVSEDTKQAMIQSRLTRKELDLLANELSFPLSPKDLQNQEKLDFALAGIRMKIADLNKIPTPEKTIFDTIFGTAEAQGNIQNTVKTFEQFEEVLDGDRIGAAFRKLKEDATDLNNRFPFTEQQIRNIGDELGIGGTKALVAQVGFKRLATIFKDGVVDSSEFERLNKILGTQGLTIQTSAGSFSIFQEEIEKILSGQIKFRDENGELISDLRQLDEIIRTIAASYGLAESKTLSFGEKIKDIKSFLKENDAQFDKTLANLQTFAKGNKSLTITLLKMRKALAIGNMILAFTEMSTKGFKGFLLGLSILAKGLAQIGQFDAAIASAKSAALGADFIADRPQLIKVGDNPQMRERVTVTPIGSPNVRGGGTSEVVVNLNGNILGTEEFVRDTLIPQLEDSLGRNLA